MLLHTHETKWGTGDSEYKEVICLDTDNRFSFVLYAYMNKPEKVVLRNLYVSPEFRGNGVGTELMKSLIEGSLQNDNSLHLWVDKNNERLINWYKRLGFNLDGPHGESDVWMSINNSEAVSNDT